VQFRPGRYLCQLTALPAPQVRLKGENPHRNLEEVKDSFGGEFWRSFGEEKNGQKPGISPGSLSNIKNA